MERWPEMGWLSPCSETSARGNMENSRFKNFRKLNYC